MAKKTKSEIEYREELAILCNCRSMLYLSGIITDAENDKIHKRIHAFQDKHKIGITDKQIHSVEFKYKD